MTNMTKTGREITQRQNQPTSLRLLAAQRRVYIDEKLLVGWQISLALLNAVLGAVMALLPGMNVMVIGVGLLVTVVNESLGLLVGRKQKQAARIQEQFDCYVLELPWNKLHVGAPESAEVVERASRRYSPCPTAPLEDWYVGQLEKLPFTAARILCQRTNCAYDIGLREQYRRALWLAFGVCVSVVCIIGMFGGMTVYDWASKLLGPLLPAFFLIVRQSISNAESITRLKEIRSQAETLWQQSATASVAESVLSESSRRLQDELFDHRARSVVEFDWLYKLWRPSVEGYVTASANSLIEEFLRYQKS